MRLKIVLLILLAICAVYLIWSNVVQPIILTDLYSSEMEMALVKFWNVVFDKSVLDDPSKLTAVATGEELKHQIIRLSLIPTTYTESLRSAEVVRVIEYTPACSHIEADVEYGPGHFDYHLFFVKEEGIWKVTYTYQILPQPDFAPPDAPDKSCADFVK